MTGGGIADQPGWCDMRLERQVWLACRDEIERRSRRWHDQLLRIAGANRPSSARLGSDNAKRARAARFAPLQLAAVELAPRLSEEERAALRTSGTLPAWFVPEMQSRGKEIDREMRRR